MKKLLALLLVLVSVIGLLAGCVTPDSNPTNPTGPEEIPEEARYGGTFVLGSFFKGNLDVMSESCYDWTQNVYEKIICRDAEGQLAPGVCDFTVSDDSLTLTLWVREGVKFHDGSLVTIEDVKASFERACAMRKTIRNQVAGLVKSSTIEGNKLIIKFNSFSVNTLYQLSSNQPWVVVMPKRVCDKYGTDLITDLSDVIGTGPYKVIEAKPDEKVTMVRFDGYVAVPAGRTGQAAPKKAYFDKIIVVKQNDDPQPDFMKMVAGELDMEWADGDLSKLYTDNGLKLSPGVGMNAYYFNFNCVNPNVPTYDVNVRKAIAACMDYAWYSQMSDDAMSTKENWAPVTGAYSCEKFTSADYAGAANVELAKQYLAKSNYKGEPIKLYMGNGSFDIEPIIKPYFQAAGLNLQVVWLEGGAKGDHVASTENDWSIDWGGSAVTDMASAVASRFIRDGWQNETVEDLLADMAGYDVGSAESVRIWNQIDQLLADECPSICVGWQTNKIWVHNADLVIDCEGTWDYIWNSYWRNPSEHK